MVKRILIGILLNAVTLFIVVEFLNEVTGEGGIKLFMTSCASAKCGREDASAAIRLARAHVSV